MRIDEVINQLKSLRNHCESMIDEDDLESPWQKDIEALDYAIDYIEEQLANEIMKEAEKIAKDYPELKMKEAVVVAKIVMKKTYQLWKA